MQLLWRRRERAKQSTEKEREEEMKGATVEAGAEVKRKGRGGVPGVSMYF